MSARHLALETRGLSKSFGALRVARDIDFRLPVGARHALIGPNGAGKTTFIDLVTGRLRPSAGQILLAGSDVTSLSAGKRVKRGIGRTFQISALFAGLSVLENVLLAVRERHGAAGEMWRFAGSRRDLVAESEALLERLGLADHAGHTVRELPYGRQRLVEIAIALGLAPKVLLLDEPAAGVPSAESGLILDIVESLGRDIAVLIIEHDMELVFRLADRITVMVQGTILAEGTPQEIAADRNIRAIYLGTETA